MGLWSLWNGRWARWRRRCMCREGRGLRRDGGEIAYKMCYDRFAYINKPVQFSNGKGGLELLLNIPNTNIKSQQIFRSVPHLQASIFTLIIFTSHLGRHPSTHHIFNPIFIHLHFTSHSPSHFPTLINAHERTTNPLHSNRVRFKATTSQSQTQHTIPNQSKVYCCIFH